MYSFKYKDIANEPVVGLNKKDLEYYKDRGSSRNNGRYYTYDDGEEVYIEGVI